MSSETNESLNCTIGCVQQHKTGLRVVNEHRKIGLSVAKVKALSHVKEGTSLNGCGEWTLNVRLRCGNFILSVT